MDLRSFLQGLPPDEREVFAVEVGSNLGHLRNVSYGLRRCNPALAVAIERRTSGAVTRQELRPDDWQQIWPELETA